MSELPPQTTHTGNDSYQIRRLRPEDVDGFLELDATVWQRNRDPKWFDWKYVANPYVSEVPVFVAERDGEIVGARPFMAFRIRGGTTTRLALQPSDTMVHPDHRRRGLFTRMTERAVRFYADGDPAFCFNFPNHQSLPGYRKLGWRPAGVRVTYYRVQQPKAVLSATVDGRVTRFFSRVAAPLSRLYYRRRRRCGSKTDVAVERHPGVPVRLLASLYGRRVPDRLHAERDEAFYRWRLASPVWERATYVARCDGEPVAAAVARTRTTSDGITVTQLADVVPLVGSEAWQDALVALLGRILDDHRDSHLVAAPGSPVPRDLLADFGFRRSDGPPLSWATQRCTLVARPLGDDSWTVGGRELTDRSDWTTTFLERDTT